jgi:glycerol-3-phosphate dehydrogenase (NAD(P)+)
LAWLWGRTNAFDKNITVEGAATASAALTKAKEFGLDMPITQAVDDLIHGRLDITTAVQMLLSRPQKEE